MIRKLKWKRIPGSLVIASALVLAGTFGTAITAAAQDFDDLQAPKSPLVLEAQGSFFVGGTLYGPPYCLENDVGQAGPVNRCPYMADQMYVQYMKPKAKGPHHTPVVMIEGGGLTGKSYETTPDGRMGWDEYFPRNGHDTYVVDAPWRGRSGFNPTLFQLVHDGGNGQPPRTSQPDIGASGSASPELAWVNFRIGPEFPEQYEPTQFPTDHINEFAKQGFPNMFVPSDQITGYFPHVYEVLSELATKLGGAVLMGHSFSGWWPIHAATLDPSVVEGIIVLDGCPGFIGPPFPTPVNLPALALAGIPILGVLGDNRAEGQGVDSCDAFIDEYNDLPGDGIAEVLNPPDHGQLGNTHMLMLDKNNQWIADKIVEWIATNVD